MTIILTILCLLGWVYTLPKRPLKREKIPQSHEHHMVVDETGLHEVLSEKERKRIFH